MVTGSERGKSNYVGHVEYASWKCFAEEDSDLEGVTDAMPAGGGHTQLVHPQPFSRASANKSDELFRKGARLACAAISMTGQINLPSNKSLIF
ncbi:hypothetical protein AJ80_03819 [Polytolypa hystricis UAMH7299]|uniref:Uncharacterized protein n=1 Tax=Polytolypa hystricis (strain UAMH7299) TaxID=1447883 RepID=A0A2B7Y687_POLH7|nr:hypothetical protein AJ80_03819 [Polytolypa hystricis UAMH7299]